MVTSAALFVLRTVPAKQLACRAPHSYAAKCSLSTGRQAPSRSPKVSQQAETASAHFACYSLSAIHKF